MKPPTHIRSYKYSEKMGYRIGEANMGIFEEGGLRAGNAGSGSPLRPQTNMYTLPENGEFRSKISWGYN